MNKKTTALTPLKKYRAKVILAPIFKVVECICELAVPFIVKAIIDQGLTEGGAFYQNVGFIVGLSLSVLGLAVFGFSCTMVTQYVASRTTTSYTHELRNLIFAHINAVSATQLERFGKNKALNLVNNDSQTMQTGVHMFMRLLVRAPFLVLGSIVASFFVSVYAGLAVFVALSLCALVIFVVLKVTSKQYSVLQSQLDTISCRGEDGIVGARVVRAFNKQEEEIRDFQDASEKYRKQALLISKISAFINPLTFAFVNLAILVIVYLGSFAKPTTGLSVGSIVALISLLTQSLTALIQFTRLVTSLSKAYASMKRINSFLAIDPDIVDGPIEEGKTLKDGDTLYEFKDVCLSFGGEDYALTDLNLSIHQGERVGIIGGTGSGKSTLLALLGRFLDASKGEVIYKGEPIKNYKLNAIRSQIALVSQKPQLFKGTIRDNILLGETRSQEDIDFALKASLASEFICNYKDGIDHEVEEAGGNFSGGQKQRILLCRAILSHRPLLILDDSTSALDYKSDLSVRTSISKIPGLTTILVSQRATSIKDCQMIYVLDKGLIVGRGTHEQLLKSCDVYREIYEAQVNQK